MGKSPASLKFFKSDTMEEVTLGDFGTEYKNTNDNLLAVVVANVGESDLLSPKAKFIEAKRNDGRLDIVSYKWKSLAYNSDAIFKPEIDLPDIKAGSFMPGYTVYSENFENIVGTHLPQDWDTKGGNWEVYFLTEGTKRNSYLHHLVENENVSTGRAMPMHYPKAKNVDINVDLAVPKWDFGGIQLRVDENGYGYYIVVYPDPTTIGKVNEYYKTIIPNYTPIDPNNEAIIGIGKGYYTDLDNFDNFNIYNRCFWFPKGTGGLGLTRDTLRVEMTDDVISVYFNGNFIYKYTDPSPILASGRMALLAGRRYGAVVIFDNLEYKMQTERGVLYIKSEVPADPQASLDEDSVYYSSLLVEGSY